MSWKSVVWIGCLVPALTGCGALRHARPQSPREPDRFAQTTWNRPAPAAPAQSAVTQRPPAPAASAREVPPLPKPELPVIKPFNPALSADLGAKLGPLPAPSDADLLPAPNPPLPIQINVPAPSGLEFTPPLPAPLALPTILDDIPPIPFQPLPAAPGK